MRSLELIDLLEEDIDYVCDGPAFPRCESLLLSGRHNTPGHNVFVSGLCARLWPLLHHLRFESHYSRADVILRLDRTARLRSLTLDSTGRGTFVDLDCMNTRTLERLKLHSDTSQDLGVLALMPRLRVLDIDCPHLEMPDGLRVTRLDMLSVTAGAMPWFAAALPDGVGTLTVYCGESDCTVDISCLPMTTGTTIFRHTGGRLTMSCDSFAAFVDFTRDNIVLCNVPLFRLCVFSRVDRLITTLSPGELPCPRLPVLPPCLDTTTFCDELDVSELRRFGFTPTAKTFIVNRPHRRAIV